MRNSGKKSEKQDGRRGERGSSGAMRVCKQLAPKAAGKKGVEKEKRDKEMKVAVDRQWQHYFDESAGKIGGKAEAREG